MSTRTIVEERPKNVAVMDVFSKLIQERIIFIDGVIDEDLANGVIAQMLYLDSLDKKTPINIYINSPGGNCLDGLAIYDVSKVISAPIKTTCIGQASSMGAILMLMGEERFGLPHCRIMLHEASGDMWGKTKDVSVMFKLQKEIQEELFEIVKEKTTINPTEFSVTDKWYNSKEALECGLITKIIKNGEKS